MTDGGEEYWAESVDRGNSDEPAFTFPLHLIDLSDEQTATVRSQAEQVVGHYAKKERAILLKTFRQIAKLASARLKRDRGSRTANVYIVRVAADPTDPMSHIGDDRGTVIAWAAQFMQDADPQIGEVWRQVISGFDSMHFTARLEGTTPTSG
jgi:hypothetical protein